MSMLFFWHFRSIFQLLDYKNIAQSLERRIADLHNDCDKKDQEIARLKVQMKSK